MGGVGGASLSHHAEEVRRLALLNVAVQQRVEGATVARGEHRGVGGHIRDSNQDSDLPRSLHAYTSPR